MFDRFPPYPGTLPTCLLACTTGRFICNGSWNTSPLPLHLALLLPCCVLVPFVRFNGGCSGGGGRVYFLATRLRSQPHRSGPYPGAVGGAEQADEDQKTDRLLRLRVPGQHASTIWETVAAIYGRYEYALRISTFDDESRSIDRHYWSPSTTVRYAWCAWPLRRAVLGPRCG